MNGEYNIQEDIDTCTSKLRELSEINSSMAKKEVKQFNSRLNSLIKYEKSIKDTNKSSNKKYISISIMLSAIVLLEGLIILGYEHSFEAMFFYIFGFAFFISGHYVGMNVPFFGLIFLFTHSVTGMFIMLSSLVGESLISPVMSDLPSNTVNYIVIDSILFILATLYVIAYNVSSKIRNIKYSNYIPICIYIIAFAMAGLLNHYINYGF